MGEPLAETVRSFWHGGPLPPLARACLRSFVSHGHAVWLGQACTHELWPRRNFPWNEWKTRRSIDRYHENPTVRDKLVGIQRERRMAGAAHA